MSQVIYSILFQGPDGDMRTDITESLDRVMSKYELHKEARTLRRFVIIKHVKIPDSTEFEFEQLDLQKEHQTWKTSKTPISTESS